MTNTIDTLSDVRFWIAVSVMGVLLAGLIAYLVGHDDDDDTPVTPPKGHGDSWKGWR